MEVEFLFRSVQKGGSTFRVLSCVLDFLKAALAGRLVLDLFR